MLYRLLGVVVWRFAKRYLRTRSRRALPGRRAGGALAAVALAAAAAAAGAVARSRRSSDPS